jgi:hypothetical protein
MRTERWFDRLFEDSLVQSVVRELDLVCKHEGVIGYHYTRAFRKSIESEGLLLRTGDEWRRTFLDVYGQLFSSTELSSIQAAWKEYFSSQQRQVRDNRLWFCLTRQALGTGDADNLLTYFGGEAVYMPLKHLPAARKVLRTLGKPLVIACRLNPLTTHTFDDQPWGKAWFSAHHATVNPNAVRVDWDLYVNHEVPSESVVDVRSAEELGWRLPAGAD